MTPYCAIPGALLYLGAAALYLIQLVWDLLAIKRLSYYLLIAAVVVHALYVLFLAVDLGFNFFVSHAETFSSISLTMALIFVVINRRLKWQYVGTVLVPVIAVLFLISLPRGGEYQLAAILFDQHVLVSLHLKSAFVSIAIFSVSFVVAVARLLQDKLLKKRQINTLLLRLPALDTLEKTLNLLWMAGFALLTITLGSGVVMSLALLDRPIALSGHQLWALLAWLIYAVVLQSRYFTHRLGRKGILLSLLGFLSLLLTFLGTHS